MREREIQYCEGLTLLFYDWLTNADGFREVRDVMMKRAIELKNNDLFVDLVVAYRWEVNREHERDFDFIANSINRGKSSYDRRFVCMNNNSAKYATVIYDILRNKVKGGWME